MNYENIRESQELNELREKISVQILEIEELKRMVSQGSKKYLDEIGELKDKIDHMSTKEYEMKSSLKEGEKLKLKLKELSLFKQKADDYDNLKIHMDSVISELDQLRKEKHSIMHKLEVNKTELSSAIERMKAIESERFKLEFECEELRRENYLSDKKLKKFSDVDGNNIREMNTFNLNNLDIRRKSTANEIDLASVSKAFVSENDIHVLKLKL